jgi:ferritin-like metal-binding protein YciE
MEDKLENFEDVKEMVAEQTTREIELMGRMEKTIEQVFSNYKEIEKKLPPTLARIQKDEYKHLFEDYLETFKSKAQAMKEYSEKPESKNVLPSNYDKLVNITNKVIGNLEKVVEYYKK